MASLNTQVPGRSTGTTFLCPAQLLTSPLIVHRLVFSRYDLCDGLKPSSVTVILVLGHLFTPYSFYLLRNRPSGTVYTSRSVWPLPGSQERAGSGGQGHLRHSPRPGSLLGPQMSAWGWAGCSQARSLWTALPPTAQPRAPRPLQGVRPASLRTRFTSSYPAACFTAHR